MNLNQRPLAVKVRLEQIEEENPGTVNESDWQSACAMILGLHECRKVFSDGREWVYRKKKPGEHGDSANNLADAPRIALQCAYCKELVVQGDEHQCEESTRNQ